MVGISLAQLAEDTTVLLTDLAEAEEIVERNVKQAAPAKGSSLRFQELDWDKELPSDLLAPSSRLDLIVAADCTYNSDSRYGILNSSHVLN